MVSKVGKSEEWIMKKTEEYIHEHLHEHNLSLKEAAKHSGITAGRFCEVFYKNTGTTFVKYITELRIQKAKELLKDTDLMVLEVCRMVGLPDRHYFTKVFKKHVGISPSEYRNQYQEIHLRRESKEEIVEKAKKYIDDHYTRHTLRSKDVAQYIGVSASYYQTIFPRQTGTNFVNYVTELRIKKAKELLESTGLTVKEVGNRSGYAEASYFVKAFEKNVGVSPSEYRRQNNWRLK